MTRITDVLSQVERWTGFTSRFAHVSTGLPPGDERARLTALIAEATNLGLSRMADVCGVASRRALLRTQTWHMREETCPAPRWPASRARSTPSRCRPGQAEGWRASADGQAYYLSEPGEAGGLVNARLTAATPSSRSTPPSPTATHSSHQTVIAGTAGEAIHALDGILGHESRVSLSTLPACGGGVSDIVFAVMRPARPRLRAAHPAPVGSPRSAPSSPPAATVGSHLCSARGSTAN